MTALAMPALSPTAAPAVPSSAPQAAAPAADGGFARALQNAHDERRAPPAKAAQADDTRTAEADAETEAAGTAGDAAKDDAATALPDPTAPILAPALLLAAGIVLRPAGSAQDSEPGTVGGHRASLRADGGPSLAGPALPATAPADPAAVDAGRFAGVLAAAAAQTGSDPGAGQGGQTGAAQLPQARGAEEVPSFAALPSFASALAAAAAPPPAPAATEAQIGAPLHSPQFAPALGAQLSVMVRDGVSEARLHLNPAEMGPITVQISIDGSTARVDMSALQPQTRQVLEQAMPTLAGALRDSGLTLTGGGVFEQRQPHQPDAGSRPGGTPGMAAGDRGDTVRGAAASRPMALPRGVVDLYA